MTRPAPAHLLISGYYGFGNFGDEAILRIMVDEWRARRPLDLISVLSNAPAQTASAFAVASVARADARAVFEAIKSSDVVVSGGGGLLQNATSLRSLMYYAGIIREAKRAGRRCAIFAQGIGPLDFFGKQVVKRACADVDLAIVRDAASAVLLQPLLPRVNVEVGADPVFLAPTDTTAAARAFLENEGVASIGGDLLTVIVRKSPVLGRIGVQLAAGIDRIASAFGAHVVFVPLQRPDDVEAAIDVIRRCKTAPTLLGGGYDLPAMTALLRRSAAVVSMRLHALILAARLAIPMLAVPYDPKVGALLGELAYPLPALDRGVGGEALFERLWSERAMLADHLARHTAPLATRAAASFDRLADLVGGAVA